MIADWGSYPNFTKVEFDCRHTGRNLMSHGFMSKLQDLRERCGFPFVITSGYRDATHPVEAKKTTPGYHNQGIAVDISVYAGQAYILVAWAVKMGFTGIGVSQRSGQPRFIHLDTRPGDPVIYSY